MATILSSAVTIPANYVADGYVLDGNEFAEQGYIEDIRPPTSAVFMGSTFISVRIWDDIDEPTDAWTDVPEVEGGWTKIYTTANPFG